MLTRIGYVTFEMSSEDVMLLEELKGLEVNLVAKKYKPKRSLDANGYAWAMISKIAEKTGLTKEIVYKNYIWNLRNL